MTEVRRAYGQNWTAHSSDEALCEAVADLLSQGKVVGWFQGRSEWGRGRSDTAVFLPIRVLLKCSES